ncbi:MAG TPA: amino acid aminotransferase [Candidatus Hydrogenedentes bacterium]|nr:amino acid aminotransferase [Candidatus Hydrogenedentota bacterium]HRT22181.1 amino acid aminotransferase [Candidatus Hydrogenedentota bacterium]HRT66959.1 amino acid aminotransferase [Candidatus Hydrogenedentota bacterium]
MFESIEMAPPDPILGLTDAFMKDTRPGKINLGVGVYKDESGKTPIFASVKRAEERILGEETTKSYLPIPGSPAYGAAVQDMVFGPDHPIVADKRAVTAHTPGGTGALRVAGDFIKANLNTNRIWISSPTWENHRGVFQAAGLEVETYPYYDADGKRLAFDAMMSALESVPAGEIVLLHACCHNPTGMDPDAVQWKSIADVAARRRFLPFFDFAYQGLGDGLEQDAAGLRIVADAVDEFIVASSFAKNFGLYNERAGALTLVARSGAEAQRAFSQLKLRIRTNYSNPPSHGGAIVTTVLNDPELRALWEGEVRAMCDRIRGMRALFVETLKAKGVDRDFSFITRQRGMFSFSGLTKDQVDALRERYGIYIVASGRINVAAMTPSNMEPLCSAVADVLRG